MQPEAAKYLFDVQRAAALNILVHGYATVDDKGAAPRHGRNPKPTKHRST
jgi:hypothetical protein